MSAEDNDETRYELVAFKRYRSEDKLPDASPQECSEIVIVWNKRGIPSVTRYLNVMHPGWGFKDWDRPTPIEGTSWAYISEEPV